MWRKINLEKPASPTPEKKIEAASVTMKNPYEVLRQKERDLEKLKVEIQALKIAAPLLCPEETLNVVPDNTATKPEGNSSAASAGANNNSQTVSRWP